MSPDDPELTYGAIRQRVRQRLAADDPDVAEAFITDTCLGIAAFAHEHEAQIEALFPDPGERQLAMLAWQDEIAAVRAMECRAEQLDAALALLERWYDSRHPPAPQ